MDFLDFSPPASLVFFGCFSALMVGGALFWFRRTRGLVEELFKKVARRHKAKLGSASWISYPRLVLKLEQAEAQISCLHGSRQGRSTCTFAWVGCEGYHEASLGLRRMSAHAGKLERIGFERAETGDRSFDEVFWLEKEGADVARALLDDKLREALLAFAAESRVRVRLGRAPVYRDGWQEMGEEQQRMEVVIRGLPPSEGDVERLIVVTSLMHTRLLRVASQRGLKRSA